MDKIRSSLNELNKHEQAVSKEAASQENSESEDYVALDELDLPKRSEVHRRNTFRLGFTFEKPVTRFLLVLVIILIGFLGMYKYIGDDLIALFL